MNLATKCAAALLTIVRPDEAGILRPVIPHAEAKKLTAKQIIARFDFDHYPIAKWLGGADVPWNLVPRLRAEHRKKTAKIDLPQAAKSKRIRKQEARHKAAMVVEVRGEKADRPRPKGRPMPGSKASGWRKRMNGKVEKR